MSDWREHVNAEGKMFYHNAKTKDSVWTLPDDIKQQVCPPMSSLRVAVCDTSRRAYCCQHNLPQVLHVIIDQ